MKSLGQVQQINLKKDDFLNLKTQQEIIDFIIKENGFPIIPTRIKDIKLSITYTIGPDTPMFVTIYFLKVQGAFQSEPLHLEHDKNKIIFSFEESDVWRSNVVKGEPFFR